MPRVKVYEPSSLIEAHLLRGMLEQFQIEAQVHGDTLIGGMGELPAAGLLSISVPDAQVEEAFDILRDYEANSS